MIKTKATVRRFPAAKKREGKQRRPFKIKEILPEQKLLTLKKWTGNKNNKSQGGINIFLGQKQTNVLR